MADQDRPAPGTERELAPGIVLNEHGQIVRAVGDDGRPGARAREPRTVVELARFLADSGRLLWRVARDPRVPWGAKVVAGGAMAYVISPIDVIPDFLPGVGQLDDLFLLARAVRYLAGAAGYDLLHELWPGSDDGFALLLVLAGVKQ